MRLSTRLVTVEARSDLLLLQDIRDALSRIFTENAEILRWGLIEFRDRKAIVEVGILEGGGPRPVSSPPLTEGCSDSLGFHVALVVPTGMGAAVGGFIGDAAPLAQALEAICDIVVTHPNVVNAADFYGARASLYVDGYTLDRFFGGCIRISRPRTVRLGLIIDRIDNGLIARTLNAANAVRSVAGLQLVGYVMTREKVKAKVSPSGYGHFLAEVMNPEVLFEAAETLTARGAKAIATVTEIEGFTQEDLTSHYFNSGPNPVGSIEALISRAITLRTGVPCAHAPAFSRGLGMINELVDPRASAEPASGSGLPCLLYGLAHAAMPAETAGISVSDLSAVIMPFDCAGGPPSLAAHQFGIPLIAVRDNRCRVGVAADKLSLSTLTVVENYAEALGAVVCMKAGLTWESIRRPFPTITDVGSA